MYLMNSNFDNSHRWSKELWRVTVVAIYALLLAGCKGEPQKDSSFESKVQPAPTCLKSENRLFPAARQIAVTAKAITPEQEVKLFAQEVTAMLLKKKDAPSWLAEISLWEEFGRAVKDPIVYSLISTCYGDFLIFEVSDPVRGGQLILAIDLDKKMANILESRGMNVYMALSQEAQMFATSAALAWHAATRIEMEQVEAGSIKVSQEEKGLMTAGYLIGLEQIYVSSIKRFHEEAESSPAQQEKVISLFEYSLTDEGGVKSRDKQIYCDKDTCSTDILDLLLFQGEKICIKNALVSFESGSVASVSCEILNVSAQKIHSVVSEQVGVPLTNTKSVFAIRSEHSEWILDIGKVELTHWLGQNVRGEGIDKWSVQFKATR